MKYIIDTSVLIDYLRGGTAWKNFLSNLSSDDEIFTPAIIAFELFSGLSSKKPDQIKKIKKLLDYFEVIDLNWNIGKIAGEIYRDKEKNIQVPDYIIAATAIEIGATVVTLNKKHFEKIENLMVY